MVIFGLKNHAPEDFAETSKQEHLVIKQELSLDQKRTKALQHLAAVFEAPPVIEPPVVVGGSKANGADH
jgi:hypothetical protein